MNYKNLDFEVIKERWGKYLLDDGSILKFRTILTSVKSIRDDKSQKYNTSVQNIQTLYGSEQLRGEPGLKTYTNKDLLENIEKDDVSFEILESPMCDYFLADDTKVKIFPQLIKVMRSSLKNSMGEPVYLVNSTATINFEVRKIS